MRTETVLKLKKRISTIGYFNRRMHYFHRKQRKMEFLLGSTNPSIDHKSVFMDLIRFQRKAEWYRKREDGYFRKGRNTYDVSEPDCRIIELELTREKYRQAISNYGQSAHSILTNIFGISIPDEWRK